MEEEAIQLLEDMKEIANALAEECGSNLDYCPSIDLSVLPVIVALLVPDCWDNYFDGMMDKEGLETCRFLSENGNVLPNSLEGASLEQYSEYIKLHHEEILQEIRKTAEGYYEEYIGRKFNS